MPDTCHRTGSSAVAAATPGSRRRKLWELHADAHVPLLALAWPAAALRAVLDGLFQGRTSLSNHALHAATARECGTRNRVSEHLHRVLERRGKPVIATFAAAKSAEALDALWQEGGTGGAFTAVVWATLTHPQCTEARRNDVLDAVQAAAHGALDASLTARRALDTLHAENAVLARELARAQQRSTLAQQTHAAALQTLRTQLADARAEILERDTSSRRRAEELAASETPARHRWTERIAALGSEIRTLRAALATAHGRVESASVRQPHGDAAEAGEARYGPSAAALAADEHPLVDLRARSVLCVGGRSPQVPVYRELVERQGGRFAHHDGGIDHTAQRLDAVLAAADLVICQTGCISHNAYWLVKDHCKRTGKRCVYLQNPSATSFARGLSRLPQAPAAEPALIASAATLPDAD